MQVVHALKGEFLFLHKTVRGLYKIIYSGVQCVKFMFHRNMLKVKMVVKSNAG